MVATGTLPAPSRLEQLAFQADLEVDELRALLHRLVDARYGELLEQVLAEIAQSPLGVESQP